MKKLLIICLLLSMAILGGCGEKSKSFGKDLKKGTVKAWKDVKKGTKEGVEELKK